MKTITKPTKPTAAKAVKATRTIKPIKTEKNVMAISDMLPAELAAEAKKISLDLLKIQKDIYTGQEKNVKKAVILRRRRVRLLTQLSINKLVISPKGGV